MTETIDQYPFIHVVCEQHADLYQALFFANKRLNTYLVNIKPASFEYKSHSIKRMEIPGFGVQWIVVVVIQGFRTTPPLQGYYTAKDLQHLAIEPENQ